MKEAQEIYNDLMAEKPEVACKIDLNDVKAMMKENEPRLDKLKKEIN